MEYIPLPVEKSGQTHQNGFALMISNGLKRVNHGTWP